MRSLEDDVLDLLRTEFREDLTDAQMKCIADQLQRRRSLTADKMTAPAGEEVDWGPRVGREEI